MKHEMPSKLISSGLGYTLGVVHSTIVGKGHHGKKLQFSDLFIFQHDTHIHTLCIHTHVYAMGLVWMTIMKGGPVGKQNSYMT